jgi:hypothetical protein
MPTKTDRILSYLPGTFRALPRPTALYSVADAFGGELLQAENTLAQVMRSHWVDDADQGQEFIDDLTRIGSLYGLAPRDDEDVEDFRDHLKRYVRTFLEGTPTVQGIMRVVAESLGLVIADSYDQIDTWWTRAQDSLTTVEVQGDDASQLLFGAQSVTSVGTSRQPARISGVTDLSLGVDLRGNSMLGLKVDATAPIVLDMAPLVADLTAATLDEIVAGINGKVAGLASRDTRHLILTSSTTGPASRLIVQDVAQDAAFKLLGLAPRSYNGDAAVAARISGTVDLSAGKDLSQRRYLRLLIDGTRLAEVDCAGANPAATTLAEITAAINTALKLAVATQDGHVLTLSSPTIGASSAIQFQAPAAQDATQTLFGPVFPIYTGADPLPARVTGTRDLSRGIDLSARFNVAVTVDGGPLLTVNCAGAIPQTTSLSEIVSAINTAAGRLLASHDGKFVTLTAGTPGLTGSIVFSGPSIADATLDIFGIAPRGASGLGASAASIATTPLSGGTADVSALHLLQVAVDGGGATRIDLWSGAADRRAATLGELVATVNAALGSAIASHDGSSIALTSVTSGSASSIAVVPVESTSTRRFVSRAFVINEAAQNVLGVASAEAYGTAATPARVEGTVDLSRGVDVRDDPYLQLSVDGGPGITIDSSAGVPRPRVALPDELVATINTAIDPHVGSPIASHDGRHLFFTSPTSGGSSSIAFQPVLAADALSMLGLSPGTWFGHDDSSVVFQGLVDLSSGLDLNALNKIKLAVDGAPAVEITCAGADPVQTTLSEIVTRINTALGSVVAAPGGKTIVLTSPGRGTKSKIEFLVPPAADATKKIFGISARSYQGDAATAPQTTGKLDLSGGVDLRVPKFLQLATDGGAPQDIDCSAGAANPASAKLAEIVAAINTGAGRAVASSLDGIHLTLSSPTTGVSAKLVVNSRSSAGALQRLMGSAPSATAGTDAAPAIITGTVDLLAGANLQERRVLRLAVDGGRPTDIDIFGAAPAKTFLDEMIAKIDQVFPGLASATNDDRLALSSPSRGESSHLQVLPVRAIEVVEFPPTATVQALSLKHGDRFQLVNPGAVESALQIEITAPQGKAGIEFVNRSSGLRIRFLVAIPVGGSMRVWRDSVAGLQAQISDAAGAVSLVPHSRILTGPLGSQAWVPFTGLWPLRGGDADNWATLQLNPPRSPNVTVLRARQRGVEGDSIMTSVAQAAVPATVVVPADGSRETLTGRLQATSQAFTLLDGTASTVATLRAGPGVDLRCELGSVVAVGGIFYAAEAGPPLMVVDSIAALFDVTLQGTADDGGALVENYPAVSIGTGIQEPENLSRRILAKPSALVVSDELDKAAILTLAPGRSDWSYLSCDGARYDEAEFDISHFAGGLCFDQGIFDISGFSFLPPEPECAVFGNGPADTAVNVKLLWTSNQPGAFAVNLPLDLPEKFGARFDQARFARPGDSPESFNGVVMEPAADPDYVATQVNAKSSLVKAAHVARVPLGWEAMTMPFRHPRAKPLTGATDTTPAALYLAETGVPGFVELRATQAGLWGNTIEVTARKNSPGRFDLTIGYEGAVFENARETVLAGRILAPGEDPLPALTAEILKPRPVGVLQGKAAGVLAEVTRDRTDLQH